MQPLDHVVIACVKKHYQQKFKLRAGDLIDDGHTDIWYKVDVLTARLWIFDIRYRIQNDVILSSWMKSTIVQSP